jgi:hypothetical protein
MILAILAISVVIPAITKYSEDAKASAFAANLRHFGRKFQLHEQQSGLYPDDEVPGVLPLEMDGEVDAAEWAAQTPVGGNWDWDYDQHGVTAGLSVYMPDSTDAQMAVVDGIVDDGDLNTGSFRKRIDGFIFVLSQ